LGTFVCLLFSLFLSFKEFIVATIANIMGPKDDLEFHGAGPKNKTPTSARRIRPDINYSESRSNGSITRYSGSSRPDILTPSKPPGSHNRRTQLEKHAETSSESTSSLSYINCIIPQRPGTHSETQSTGSQRSTSEVKMGPIKESCEFTCPLPVYIG
jgi:hypothetical protein